MTNEHIIQFDDPAYTIKVSHTKMGDGDFVQLVFHKKLEDSIIDSKFEVYLDEKQYTDLANFLWFLTGRKV
jgi:hypothetical protein